MENTGIGKEIHIDELRLECKRLEMQYQEMDETLTKLEREDADYYQELQKEKNQIESLREDCQGDKTLLHLVDEKFEQLRKVERAREDLEETLRKERKKAESESQEGIKALQKQIEERED